MQKYELRDRHEKAVKLWRLDGLRFRSWQSDLQLESNLYPTMYREKQHR